MPVCVTGIPLAPLWLVKGDRPCSQAAILISLCSSLQPKTVTLMMDDPLIKFDKVTVSFA